MKTKMASNLTLGKKYFRLKELTFYLAPLLILLIPILYYIYITGDAYRTFALELFNNTSVILRRAVENPDGSFDVLVRIPGSSERLGELVKRGYLNPYVDCRGMNNIPKRTLYPLTLDSPYIINNPNICTDVDNLKFIIIVHSATGNFQRRRLIRETWANKNLFKTINLRIVFLFGLTKVTKTQELIEIESVAYGDIVQGDFLDTYHNLTHKGVLAYRWIQDFCQEAEMVVKTDDDMFINIFLMIENVYPKFKSKKRTFWCHRRKKGTSPIFRGASKWYVDDKQFRGFHNYPTTYCNGYVVLISRDIIRPMYRASYITPFFWVDDVYLYGMLPHMIGGVTHEDIRANMTLNASVGTKCYTKTRNCSYLAVNHGNTEGAVENLWYQVLAQLSPAMKKEINPILIS